MELTIGESMTGDREDKASGAIVWGDYGEMVILQKWRCGEMIWLFMAKLAQGALGGWAIVM